MKALLILLLCFEAFACAAKEDTLQKRLSLGAYVESYYCYDLSRPASRRLPFFYNYSRHNEPDLNLAVIRLDLKQQRVRASAGLMAGRYSQENLAHEPPLLRHLFEASAGVKLASERNIWLDGGVFPSHIGFESAIGSECWTLTRSILADNSPYYESGLRLSFESRSQRWKGALLLLNGWQRIHIVRGEELPSLGTMVRYSAGEKLVLNWSTFAGKQPVDGGSCIRYYNNLYAVFNPSGRLAITAGFDIGNQQSAPNSHRYKTWYSPVLIARYRIVPGLHAAARGELYIDPENAILPEIPENPSAMSGISLNIDYALSSKLLWRLEGRRLNALQGSFPGGAAGNTFFTTALAISF